MSLLALLLLQSAPALPAVERATVVAVDIGVDGEHVPTTQCIRLSWRIEG
jgi:hypothetical protein